MSEPSFSSIVVALDFTPESERAVAAGSALSILAGLPLKLLTVSSEDRKVRDKLGLRHVANRFGLINWESVALHDTDPARAICRYMADRGSALLVMASDVRGALAELASRSTVARVLRDVNSPVLVVGPHVGADWKPAAPRLIACAHPGWDADEATQAIVQWTRTFDAPAIWAVEVIDAHDPIRADTPEDRLSPFTDRLTRAGVSCEPKVLHGSKAVEAILQFVDLVADGVPMVTTERWADPAHVHAHSVARRLAHKSRRPVLVVPHAAPALASRDGSEPRPSMAS